MKARTWDLKTMERDAVAALPPERRFEHFVKRVVDWEFVWGLAEEDDGLLVAADDSGRRYLPLWPHGDYARLCATGAWKDREPRALRTDVLTGAWIRGLIDDGILVSVFPTPSDAGLIVEPAALKARLEEHLSDYYGPVGFADRQLGVFASRDVIDGSRAVELVFHHDEDDAWEFLTGDEESVDQIALVHVIHLLEADPSLRDLEDLPAGWKAWRGAPKDDWVREPTPEDQPTLAG
jgi:hypothetical protein